MEDDYGPEYNIDGAALKKFRHRARRGLAAMSREDRRAYGAAVEAAVLSAQRAALRRGSVALPRIYGKNENIGAMIRAQHRNALQAHVTKVRRERTHLEWQTMYDAAMVERRKREAEPPPIVKPSNRRERAEAHLRAARARLEMA